MDFTVLDVHEVYAEREDNILAPLFFLLLDANKETLSSQALPVTFLGHRIASTAVL